MAKIEPKRMAFRAIMNCLTEFSMGRQHQSGQEWPPFEGYAFRPINRQPNVDDLVILTSKPSTTKWYLS